IRTRIVGMVYDTRYQSVVAEVIDDGVTMSVIVLHERDHRYGREAVGAVEDADAAVTALGDLAADLAVASGAERGPRRDAARDLGSGRLDGPYRQWLRELGDHDNPQAARVAWQRQAHRMISTLARDLLDSVGRAAWEGRVVDAPKGAVWLDDTAA